MAGRIRIRFLITESIRRHVADHPVGPKLPSITTTFADDFDYNLALRWRSENTQNALTPDEVVNYCLEKVVEYTEMLSDEDQ